MNVKATFGWATGRSLLGTDQEARGGSGASRTRTGDLLGAIGPRSIHPKLPRLVQVTQVEPGSLRFAQFGITSGSTGVGPADNFSRSMDEWSQGRLSAPPCRAKRVQSNKARRNKCPVNHFGAAQSRRFLLTRSCVVGRKRPSSLAEFRPTIEGRSECPAQLRLRTAASGFPSRRN